MRYKSAIAFSDGSVIICFMIANHDDVYIPLTTREADQLRRELNAPQPDRKLATAMLEILSKQNNK